MNGVELIKRYSNKQAYGLTTPLITLASGAKMGKTEKGAIWLDKKSLSAYEYWQFWRNVDDRDVIKFLKIFTDLEIDEINNLQNKNINELKILLANESTTMLHGKKSAIDSERAAKEAFSKALGTGISKGINFNEIIILNEKNGKPFIRLLNKTKKNVEKKIKKKKYKISLSLSDEKNYAVAFVTISI